MYHNAGQKIKSVARFACTMGIFVSVICALTLLVMKQVGLAILVVVIGCFISWLSVLLLYAFGDLVENVAGIRAELARINNTDAAAPKEEGDQWICGHCFEFNPQDAQRCIHCGAEKD